MVDWNVNPSPLDGAVVGTRERWGWVGWGGLACTLTSIKTVISQPVCALTDHSKHYAQHRGWTTLDYSTEIMFFLFVFFSATPRRAETMLDKLHCRFLRPLNVVSSHVGCCAHISVSCLCSYHSPSQLCSSATAHRVVLSRVSPSSQREGEEEERLCTFIKRNKIIGLIGLVVVKETCVETPPKEKTQQHIPQLPAHHIHASTFIILLIFI